ncbi:CoA pyrophosphatase [Rhodobacter sp. NSM]|uniref:CoA pyrophosphatase n=1 Tax=Rhodobacter sp. NSM TaxID=3457501 RepID=UPI003FD55569
MPEALRRALESGGAASSDHDLDPGMVLPPERRLRAAAVLVPVWQREGGAQVILTKRASHLAHHPGQIAFPGGKIDPEDASAEAAALREAREEIGLPETQVHLIGRLPSHETVTGYTVVPVLAQVHGDFVPVLQEAEVEEAFTVPLSHVLDLARYRVERRLWRGGWRSYYVVPYGPYYIWGATARILRGFAERMQP